MSWYSFFWFINYLTLLLCLITSLFIYPFSYSGALSLLPFTPKHTHGMCKTILNNTWRTTKFKIVVASGDESELKR